MFNFVSAFEKQLKKEQEELEVAEEVTEAVFPHIDNLERKDICNPVSLKAKTGKIDKEYRDAVYGLCRIAVEGGPADSVVVLDPAKVDAIIDSLESDPKFSKKSGKKYILGITSKIIGAVKGMLAAKLSVLCYLINDLILHKVINVPSPDQLKAATLKVKSLMKDGKERSF